MNIKTFMAMAVVALTAACNEKPAAPAAEATAEATAENTTAAEPAAEPALGENEKPR